MSSRGTRWMLYKWAETVLLREPNENVRVVLNPAHYAIGPTGRDRREVVPKAQRPVIEASGRQYAGPASESGYRHPSDPHDAMSLFLVVEGWFKNRPQLRAFAVHRYAYGRKVSDFPDGPRLNREILRWFEPDLSGYDEERIGRELAERESELQASKQRDYRARKKEGG